jgi:hypothetical protein
VNAAQTKTPVINVTKEWSDPSATYQEISWSNYVITTRLAKNAPPDAEFLPSKVTTNEGRELWRFSKQGNASMAFLREYGDELLIAATTPYSLVEIVFIADILKTVQVKVQGVEKTIPARPIIKIALAKREVADELQRDAILSQEEVMALKQYDEKERAARIAREAAVKHAAEQQQKEEHDRAVAVKTEKINKIMARQEIHCFTADGGQPRHGRPVVGTEWECLKNSQFCILVSSFNEETREAGELIEAFRVAKNGSKVKKQNPERVQRQQVQAIPKGSLAMEIEAEDLREVEVGGQVLMVPIYTGVKPSDIKLPVPFGVRGGNAITVYVSEGEKLRTLGIVRSQAEANPA